MRGKPIQSKGILAKLLEKGIEILLNKECKKIGKTDINIIASSLEIIKGIIPKIHISAKDINYKNLLFDEIELEANNLKIRFKISNKELNFKNDFSMEFKVSLSENSLKTILFSDDWNWMGDLITKKILDQDKLYDIKIKNDQLFIKASKDNQTINYKEEKVTIRTEDGKLYLENKAYKKYIKIPLEDKVCIENVNIKHNLIIIYANSSISFN